MNDRISIPELRGLETHQWGPYSWDERGAGPPLVEVPKDLLLALVEAVEAAQRVAPFLPTLHRDALNRYLAKFDFGDGAEREHKPIRRVL